MQRDNLDHFQSFFPSTVYRRRRRHKPLTTPPLSCIVDGLTSTRKIRAFEAETNIWPPSVIIALTGLASAEAQEDALSAGINNFLVKPVKFGELNKLLQKPGGGS